MGKRESARHVGLLSRERIGATALAIVDRDGLEALSARRLAADLGCEAMSLYHHVESMEDVRDLVVDRLFAELPDLDRTSPRKALANLARAYLDMADAHPHAFVLAATRLLRAPRALAAAAAGADLFVANGATPRDAQRRMRILAAYLNGAALALGAWRTAGAKQGGEAVRSDLEHGLKHLLESLA